ncbi:MAG: phosphate ABC transporter ATP-binding protein PstB [bacterium]|nr:phosphate ABC transporter ATP-binding protein PstB [bacterium]
MDIRMQIKDLSLWYGQFHALKNINMEIAENRITALIGPSGCGKSTLLRTLNRMNDIIDGVKISGRIFLDNKDIYQENIGLTELRKKIGMVFQHPNPFPLSIYENLTYGLRIHNIGEKSIWDEKIEKCLRDAWLWDDVKDKLHSSALDLSLDQKQKLCIARLIIIEPEVILMDEPCSTLDPIATMKIEELMNTLKKDYTIVIVTHNMQQAARVSDYSGFLLLGELIEFDDTNNIFTAPRDKRTEDYITGRFG